VIALKNARFWSAFALFALDSSTNCKLGMILETKQGKRKHVRARCVSKVVNGVRRMDFPLGVVRLLVASFLIQTSKILLMVAYLCLIG